MSGRLSYDAARQTGIESNTAANIPPTARAMPVRRAIPQAQRSQPNLRASSLEPTRLRKPQPDSKHARATSGQHLQPPAHAQPEQQTLEDFRQQHMTFHGVEKALPQPPPLSMGVSHSRDSSYERTLPLTPTSAAGSRPVTPQYSLPKSATATTPTSKLSKPADKRPTENRPAEKKPAEKKKHGWFGRSKDKHKEREPVAWIAGHTEKLAFDIENMLKGVRVPELWDEVNGNCFVYLFPRQSGKGPSFRLDSSTFGASPVLTKLAFGQVYSAQHSHDAASASTGATAVDGVPMAPSSLSSDSSRGHLSDTSTRSEVHLYLTLKLSDAANSHGLSYSKDEPTTDDVQALVDFRNLFAFLSGQSIVATEKKPSLFAIFVSIGSLLKAYEFSNIDGSTFGEVASSSFDNYAEELGLLDVRSSREKTIEGIVLGERLRSQVLYTEAFTHAVGKLDDIAALHSPKYDMISSATKTRLTRAHLSLEKRQQAIQLTLKDFDFHSLFSGIMNSKTAEERKEGVRFDAWKEAVLNTKKWMLASLKMRYGDWPPRAKSKKNDLGVDGLQRQVVQDLYHDMCSMYDLLVDKTQLTTRTADGIDRAGPVEAPKVRALRSILSEFDRSSPPVKPPIPFDLPMFPTLHAIRKDFGTGDIARDAKLATKKLRDDEIATILRKSYNHDAALTPFVGAFTDMERRAAHGCSLQEITDLRTGQWIFMYAVLQLLPLLACDAPGLRHTQGVEYFLCEPPRGYMPWVDPEKASQQRTWFAVNGASSMVSLPAHLLEHSIEAVYRRSHCWTMAEKWTAENPLMNQALHEQSAVQQDPSLLLPNSAGDLPMPRTPASRTSSPSRSQRNSSIGFGLEALPLPPSIAPEGPTSNERPRSVHVVDANKTFDSIIANMNGPKSKKK